MTQLQLQDDRAEHPLDEVERLAANEQWAFERFDADEMCVSLTGRWSDYQIAFTWIPEVEALHIACAFDLKVHERRRNELIHLVSMINEQLWVGHFDLWSARTGGDYRHGPFCCVRSARCRRPQSRTADASVPLNAVSPYYSGAFQVVVLLCLYRSCGAARLPTACSSSRPY